MSREFSSMRFGKGANSLEICLERKVRKSGFAGFVTSTRFRESITIIVNDALLDEHNVRCGYITVRKDGTNPIIILENRTFNEIKRGVPTARLLLFHEIGHYCCGHLDCPPELETEFERRNDYAEQNGVSPEELEADNFAVEYLGADYVAWALQDWIDERATIDLIFGVGADPISGVAIKEYQARIDAINERYNLGLYD